MLNVEETVLVVVDFQEKLMAAIHNKEELLREAVRLVQGANVLGLPILWSEQNPKGLGPTVPELASLMTDYEPITKISFSCCGEEKFKKAFDEIDRDQVLVAGIESHVCVYQTVVDLLDEIPMVGVVADAVSSRTPENKAIGIERCRDEGAFITSTECALFELLKAAEGDKFKQMLKVVK
ncbi:hydrolase [Thermodesulfobacteriota bacterium]